MPHGYLLNQRWMCQRLTLITYDLSRPWTKDLLCIPHESSQQLCMSCALQHIPIVSVPQLSCVSPPREVPIKWVMIDQLLLWIFAAWAVLHYLENALYIVYPNTHLTNKIIEEIIGT